jgi:O-antigen/teichoic acid export membrane protein
MALSVYILCYYYKFSVELLVALHITVNLISSLIAITLNISGISKLSHFEKTKFWELIHFGKYSFGTLIGTNLLKSSDTFIIGLVAGSQTAALYSIPLKLTETFEILLRSMVSVAMPKLSSFSLNNEKNKVKELFQKLSGILTLIYLPIMIICFLLSDHLILFLGGKEYLQTSDIFKVFCIYGLILPVDRFTGITLDCINLPKYNFYKVCIMITVNVILDLAILHLNLPLKYVAFATFLTTLTGCYFGIKYLNLNFKTSFKDIILSGWVHSKRIGLKSMN